MPYGRLGIDRYQGLALGTMSQLASATLTRPATAVFAVSIPALSGDERGLLAVSAGERGKARGGSSPFGCSNTIDNIAGPERSLSIRSGQAPESTISC